MKQLVFAICLFCGISSFSQKVVDLDKQDANSIVNLFTVSGTPINPVKYVRVVSGSPYFSENWIKGSLTLSEGKVYNDLFIRLDLLENAVQYKDPNGAALIASTPLRAITLYDSNSPDSFQFVHSNFIVDKIPGMETGWYQVAASGNATLYRLVTKQITESTPYGSATVEQAVVNNTRHYLFHNNTFVILKKFKDIPEILKPKASLLESYVKSNKLYGKNEEDYTSLIKYYNTLN